MFFEWRGLREVMGLMGSVSREEVGWEGGGLVHVSHRCARVQWVMGFVNV